MFDVFCLLVLCYGLVCVMRVCLSWSSSSLLQASLLSSSLFIVVGARSLLYVVVVAVVKVVCLPLSMSRVDVVVGRVGKFKGSMRSIGIYFRSGPELTGNMGEIITCLSSLLSLLSLLCLLSSLLCWT